MIEKYKINVEKPRFICLQYNWRKKELTIGGYSILRSDIELFFNELFGFIDEVEFKFTQKNKIRFTIPISPSEFREGLKMVQGYYQWIQVSTFDREM